MTFKGGAGKDSLSGNKGIDTLDGGLHADTLTGGADGDCLLFRTRLHGNGTISDYELDQDEIKVTGPVRRTLFVEDTEGGMKISDGANWSLLLEDISMGDWFQAGDSLF
ncbi:hypothetical protein [Leisingera methylohalidivorans]|uniref:hypothetical protein n=1 Tax=Leisingera methylohalidivorans TaxID=133924 RepID=UPI0003FC28A3|nr:hypothetical protein [Leisingera methylohalidivorans]